MIETSADRYNRKAEECRNAAELASNGVDKADWLKLAEEWLKMAENAVARNARGHHAA